MLIPAKEILCNYKILYLADLDYNWFSKLVSSSVERLIKKIKHANLDGLNIWAGKTLNSNFVMQVKGADLFLYVWTVNNPNHAKHLIDLGIDGITTDRAEWLLSKLSKS